MSGRRVVRLQCVLNARQRRFMMVKPVKWSHRLSPMRWLLVANVGFILSRMNGECFPAIDTMAQLHSRLAVIAPISWMGLPHMKIAFHLRNCNLINQPWDIAAPSRINRINLQCPTKQPGKSMVSLCRCDDQYCSLPLWLFIQMKWIFLTRKRVPLENEQIW